MKDSAAGKPSLIFSVYGASLPLFHFFYGAYPFLHLWAENCTRGMGVSKLFYPFLISTAAIFAVFILLCGIYRNALKSAIVTVLMTLVFFSYGHIYLLIIANLNLHPRLPAGVFLFIFFAIPFLGSKISLSLQSQKGRLWNAYLNLAALVLILYPLAQLSVRSWHVSKEALEIPGLQLPQITKKPEVLPDIYYIIPDEYGRADVLKSMFNYDNEPFIRSLESKGFYVARQATSNYAHTVYSLSSSLNFNYLPEGIEDWTAINMIRSSSVMRILRKLGYRYYFVNSGQTITEYAPMADKLISYWGADDVRLLFINSTLLRAFSTFLLAESWRERHLYNFEQLSKVPEDKGPKFIFAHMILPHPPIVFKKDGSIYSTFTMTFTPRTTPRSVRRYKDGYAGQVEYTNFLLMKLIDDIFAKSKTPPVIIMQSDHGVDPLVDDIEQGDGLYKRMANFAAIYADPEMLKNFYPEVTPVNIFRILFDHYFGTNMGVLPDRSFVGYTGADDAGGELFKWKDVTAKTRGII